MYIYQTLDTHLSSMNRTNLPDVPIFWNRTVDKGTMKRLIAWFLVHYGRTTTVSMIEDLKQVGFQHATRAGISLGIEDLRVPPSKPRLIREANREINTMETRYHQGYVSVVERFQKVIDTWNGTSEMLKDDVVENFLATDPLNPVYMMAFSGARGNLSQVRQLVGMRGLMSNPQGEIIDLPIRSNFREGLTVTEYIISCYGARKGLVDTALRTANSGYLTRRLVDVAQDIVIRMTSCHVDNCGLPLMPFHSNNQVVYPLEERLLGRVLSIGALDEEGELLFGPNIAISQAIASALVRPNPKAIFVRTILMCEAKRGLCRLCYGWNLATGTIVSVGEAVGIIAAQSIGEPGTQLTMRTFHTGGVFSARAVDEIRAPLSGVVLYPRKVKAQFVRTRHGESGILTSEEMELIFEDKNGQTVVPFPTGTILTVCHGEQVHLNQLIGEIASYAGGNPVTSWKNLKSDLDGEIVLDQLEVLRRSKRKSKKTHTVKVDPLICNKGHVWVLQGDVHTFEMPMHVFTKPGDIVEAQSIVSCTTKLSPVEGRVTEISDRKVVVTRNFGSFKFQGVDAWIPYESEQTIQTKAGTLVPSKAGEMVPGPQSFELSPFPAPASGTISFDWPAYPETWLDEEEEDTERSKKKDPNPPQEPIQVRTPYPLQYFVTPEDNYTVPANESWMLNVMAGQSVGPGHLIASKYSSEWTIENGQLKLRGEEYIADHQAWVEIIVPSLLDIEAGNSRYQIITKQGWVARIPDDLDVNELSYSSGSVFFGKWSIPTFQCLVEQAGDRQAILIRPIYAMPVYPTSSWDESLELHETIYEALNESWHPRAITVGRPLDFQTPNLRGIQTFEGEETKEVVEIDPRAKANKRPFNSDHTNRLPWDLIPEEPKPPVVVSQGTSPIDLTWNWPRNTSPWVSPAHAKKAGSFTLVMANQLAMSPYWNRGSNRYESMIANASTRPGVHRFTPILHEMTLSSDYGEIQRLLPKRMRKAKRYTRYRDIGIFQPAKGRFFPPAKGRFFPPAKGRSRRRRRRAVVRIPMMKRMILVRPDHLMTFATYGARVCVPLGGMIYQGEELMDGVSSPVAGKVVEIRRDRVTLRMGQPYRVGWQARLVVQSQEIVKAQQVLANLLYFKTKTGDIVQGLPKIEEVLEARRKKGNETIRYNPQDIIRKVHRNQMQRCHSLDLANRYTVLEMQIRLLRRVQLVYRSQGVQISDKHIEIIVLRMTSRVIVNQAAGTGILPGELLEKRRVDHLNRNRRRIHYTPVVLGITKAALTTKGFISGASFQETTRVLTQAVLKGKADWLQGLKENVILGRLIPAGVGIYGHWVPTHETNTEKMLERWVLPRIITGQAAMRALFHTIPKYCQDLENVFSTPKKVYPQTPYQLHPDWHVPLALSRWMTEQEIQALSIDNLVENIEEPLTKTKRSKKTKKSKKGKKTPKVDTQST